jgi:hypothetical protein
MAGYITELSGRHLVIVSILDVESLQQIAGVYQEYGKIEEIDKLIPLMAKGLAQSAQRDTSRLPGLSIPPFDVANGVNESDAQTLAQILACDIANGNAYAVLPRTDSLEKVRAEQERQRSGETDQERVKRLGVGRNALYVLAGSVTKLGSLNKFAADVLDIKDFVLVDGYSEQYTALTDGIALMPKLAANVNNVGSSTIIIKPGEADVFDQITAEAEAAAADARKTDNPEKSAGEKDPPADFTTGRRVGAGFLNLALGIGSFTMGDWAGGLTLAAGYAAAGALIAVELAALEYDDAAAGVLGPIGVGVAGVTAAYGFIRPFFYHKKSTRTALIDIFDRVIIAIIPDTTGIKAVGLSYTYHY